MECQHCHCVGTDGEGGFSVTVPVSMDAATIGEVRLQGQVRAESHRLEWIEWTDAEHRPVIVSSAWQQQLSSILQRLAEKKVCGNPQLCPSEVVRIATQSSTL